VLEGAPTDGNISFALSRAAADTTDRAGDRGDHHCQSIDHHRRLLDDPPGDPTRWLPRLRIKQTSSEGYGQIYVGVVNWLLMIVTVGLTIGFGKSDNLAAAYGIAVSLTMLMTSALLFIAMREIWAGAYWLPVLSRPAFWSSTALSSLPISPRSPKAAISR